MPAVSYNYAVYTEIVFGKRIFQGWGKVDGQLIEEWLPLAEPKDTQQDAVLDCFIAHRALEQAGFAVKYRLDPNVRQHNWSGIRRVLR